MKRGRESSNTHDGHPLSIYSIAKPDFASLGRSFPSLAQFLVGKNGLDFSDPAALAELTKALLFVDFDLKIELPCDRLCPTVTSRLNYILYLCDLLKRDTRLRIQDGTYVRETFGGDSQVEASISGYSSTLTKQKQVLGLDIGCGASAIYSLLGCRLFGWRFVCSELDPVSLASAKANADLNGMGDSIRFVQAPDSSAAIKCCFDGDKYELPMFTMCNPPFFEDVEEAAQGPRNTVISASEAATSGGEVEFVARIIEDSVLYRDKIALYSSLVGKKSSLKPLRALLAKHNCPVVHSTRLEQGKTHRWVLAWSFRTPLFPRVISEPPGNLFDNVKQFLTASRCVLRSCDRAALSISAELVGAFAFSFQIMKDHLGRIVACMSRIEGDKDMFEEFEMMIVEKIKF